MSDAVDRDTSNTYSEAAHVTVYRDATVGGHARVHNGHVYGNVVNHCGSGEPSTPEDRCLQSLAFPDMGRRRGGILPKAENTCEWILQHEQYLVWAKNGGFLWIKGRAGTGKSTLMNAIVTNAETSSPPNMLMASFFFHRRGSPLQYTSTGLFRSLLHQLLCQDRELISEFSRASGFDERCKNEGEPGKGWHWTEAGLRELLAMCLQQTTRNHSVRIHVDALDESDEATASDLVDYFGDLRARLQSSLNICISCRPYPNLVCAYDHLIEVEAGNQTDINTYLDAKFRTAIACGPSKDVELVKSLLRSRASGVFQWVVLVTRQVLQMRQQSMGYIIDRIRHVPKELADLYEEILGQMSFADRKSALPLLKWITFAVRPLSLAELRFAIAMDAEKSLHHTQDCEASDEWCKDDKEMRSRLLQLSQGLVSVTDTSTHVATVQFNHESVQNYMESSGIAFLEGYGISSDSAGQAHHSISTICIRYLGSSDVMSVDSRQLDDFQSSDLDFPFLDYAVTYWVYHAKISEDCGISQSDLMRITGWPANDFWNRWSTIVMPLGMGRRHQITLQHIAAHYGLQSVLIGIIRTSNPERLKNVVRRSRFSRWHPEVLDVRNDYGETPVLLAASSGQEAVVQLLLDARKVKISLNSRDQEGTTPLWRAALNGHTSVVKLLLSTGKVDVNVVSKSYNGRTPLWWAAKNGHHAIVKMLLDTGKVKHVEHCP